MTLLCSTLKGILCQTAVTTWLIAFIRCVVARTFWLKEGAEG